MSSKGLALATSGKILAAKVIIIIIAQYKTLNKTIISKSLKLWIITEKTNQCRRVGELKLFLTVECQLVYVEWMIKLENHYFSNNCFKEESNIDNNNSG